MLRVHIGTQERLQANLCIQRGFGLDRVPVDVVCGSTQNRDAVTMAMSRGFLFVFEDNVVQSDRISEPFGFERVVDEHWFVLLTDASGASRCPATNLAVWVAWKVGEHIVCPLVFHAIWACQLLRFRRRRRLLYF